ncbi:MAG: hypothetical protein ACYTG4_14795, partial [Planctomycetota bacterium]
LHDLALEHLSARLARDDEPYWREAEEASPRTRSECERKVHELARELTDRLAASATIEFQRTLRIPDDDNSYPLPPGLGLFPLRHVDDFADKLPNSWRDRGGIMFPIHQSEALWLNFSSPYPVALQVGTGKVCAISGQGWTSNLTKIPRQNYCVLPEQPWIDGYAVEEGMVRQFVAQPLGAGFSVEEQLTGAARWGGIQLQAHPLSPETYWRETLREKVDSEWDKWRYPRRRDEDFFPVLYSSLPEASCDVCESMALSAGGRMRQEIYRDRRDSSDYLSCTGNRCFVHLCNSRQWKDLTGQAPPLRPPTADDYSRRGLPWFDYYDENERALPDCKRLKGVKSVRQMETETKKKVLPPLPDEATPKVIVKYIKE